MSLIRLILLLSLLGTSLGSRALDLSRRPQGESALLTADQAFQLVEARRDPGGIHLSWLIAPGYYLYRHRLAVEPADGVAALPALRLPPGQPRHDEHFGDVEIYTTTLDADLPFAAGQRVPTRLRLRWQGCAEAGVCYPPVTRTVDIATP